MYEERRRSLDADIARLDAVIAQAAEHDRALWGSPKNEGLVPSFDRLAKTFGELTAAVTALTARLTGEEGITVTVRDLQREISDLKLDLAQKEAEAKTLLDQDRADRKERARTELTWRVALVTVFGLPSLGVAARLMFVIYSGGHGVLLP